MEEEEMTVEEVAAHFKLHPETIRRWIRSGKLKAYRLGANRAGWRIPWGEIKRIGKEGGMQ